MDRATRYITSNTSYVSAAAEVETMAGCAVHQIDKAHEECKACRRPHCADCLVYPFGPKKPPMCVPCALQAAGVRRAGRR